MRLFFISSLLTLSGCTQPIEFSTAQTNAQDLTQHTKPAAITQRPWQEVVINVESFDDIAPFFQQIGSYEILEKNEREMLLGAKGADSGFVRLRQIGKAEPARPIDSRAWNKGCYFSLMMRAKDIPSIIKDASALGWTPLTELAYLEFGPSKLNIIVLTHQSGVSVQLYERLTTPLPEGFTPFERLSRPFNIMQMVEDYEVSYAFFHNQLGFDTFYKGGPTVSKKPEVVPIGIPPELSMTTPYYTNIMTPKSGLEYGRMETIDVKNTRSELNYADRCNEYHSGIITVRFAVENLYAIRKDLRARDVPIRKSSESSVSIKTPDGANIEFFQK